MSLKLWLLALMLLVAMMICAAGYSPSGLGTPTPPTIGEYFKAMVPINTVIAAAKNPQADLTKWYDPAWDDLGWSIAKDSAAFGSQIHIPGAYTAFTRVSQALTIAESQKNKIYELEDKSGITDFWLNVWNVPQDSSSSYISGSPSPSDKDPSTSKKVNQLSGINSEATKPNQLSGSRFPQDWQTPSAKKSSGLESWGKHPKGWGVSQEYVNAHPEIYGYPSSTPSPSSPQSGSNSGSSGPSGIPTSNEQSNPNGLTPEQLQAIRDAAQKWLDSGAGQPYEPPAVETSPVFAQCYDGGCYDADGNRVA